MSKVITRRKPGCRTWEYRFESAIVNGKRQWFSKSGFKTKKEALEAGAKALAEYDTIGTVIQPSEMSVADLLDSWLNNYVRINLADSTIHAYTNIITNHLTPMIGRRKVKSMTTAILQETVNQLYTEKNFSWSSMKNIVTVLKGSFSYAQKTLKIILLSPAEDVLLPKREPTGQGVTVNEIDEIETILKYLMDYPHQYYALLIGYYTGMRISEVYGLTWDCIDFEHETITVKQIVKRLEKNYVKGRRGGRRDRPTTPWYLGTCKTSKSFRTITVGKALLDELAKYKKWQEDNENEYGEYYIHHYLQEEETSSRRKVYRIISQDSTSPAPNLPEVRPVMVRESGAYNGTNTWSHVNQVVKKKFGIDFHFHNLRHTHASILIENKASIKDVQERLGHDKAQTTLDMYVKNSPRTSRATADLFERTASIDTGTLRDPDLYRIWQTMVKRCRTVTFRAKGIIVCDDWNKSFNAFSEWAGSSGYEKESILGRYDDSKGYTPENCYWFKNMEMGKKTS